MGADCIQVRAHKETKRASETHEQTAFRLEQSRLHMASVRASETCEQTDLSKIGYTWQAREPLKHRIKHLEKSMSCKRNRCLSVESAIFHYILPYSDTYDQFQFQTVCPVTNNGTLIDHVYYRNPFSSSSCNTIIDGHDTYYSDHDTVYYSIPFIDF